MIRTTTKAEFLRDLRARSAQHCTQVTTIFAYLDAQQLTQQPSPKEWSIAQCFDHLNLTYDYYLPRMNRALPDAVAAKEQRDNYHASFWGRIYMTFAFNPRFSFAASPATAPEQMQDAAVLVNYLARQDELINVLERVGGVDLRRTRIPIERGVHFNLGDCLKILVCHDDLHFGQAKEVLSAVLSSQNQ